MVRTLAEAVSTVRHDWAKEAEQVCHRVVVPCIHLQQC